jgi:predicted nuclease with TOPRIM domain
LENTLERWAKRAAALAQIRDELRAEATVANKLAQQYLRWWQDEAEMCQKLEQERDELRADIAFLMQEYGESNEPMSKDAVELKERCHILKERDELRARVEELEKQLEIAAREITKAHEEYDMCPSDYDGKLTCVCNGTIADVWRCWRERWRQKALAMLEGGGTREERQSQ